MTDITVIIKRKIAGGVPPAADLAVGEIAVDLTNKKIYGKDSGGTVRQFFGDPGANGPTGPTGSGGPAGPPGPPGPAPPVSPPVSPTK